MANGAAEEIQGNDGSIWQEHFLPRRRTAPAAPSSPSSSWEGLKPRPEDHDAVESNGIRRSHESIPRVRLIRVKADEHADRIVSPRMQEPKGSHHDRYARTEPVSAAPQ